MKVGDKVRCIEDWGVEHHLTMGAIYTAKRFLPDGLYLELEEIEGMNWSLTRFELIKEEPMEENNEVVSAKVTNKFNPKPGDKIICNNGEEFICCTKEVLSEKGCSSKSYNNVIFAYRDCEENKTTGVEWTYFNEDTGEGYYTIREVVPAESKAVIKEEEPQYSVSEIQTMFTALVASIEARDEEWTIAEIFDIIKKRKYAEYREYLRLKAIYEP